MAGGKLEKRLVELYFYTLFSVWMLTYIDRTGYLSHLLSSHQFLLFQYHQEFLLLISGKQGVYDQNQCSRIE